MENNQDTFKLKLNDYYLGLISSEEAKETEKVISFLKKELTEREEELLQMTNNKRDSEFCYYLGEYLGQLAAKYGYENNDRFRFFQSLRENVNSTDKRKVRTILRDDYEYSYQLSLLDKKLALKYSWSKWEHLFDLVTVREDKRLFKYLSSNCSDSLSKSKEVFVNFCKGLKVYMNNYDTQFISDSQLEKVYKKITEISVIIVKYIRDTRKITSKIRDKIYYEVLINEENIDKVLEKFS